MAAALSVRELGHVSLFVRDLDASIRFYRDILGLRDVGRGKGGRIAFFSAGRHHHDLSVQLARVDGPELPRGAPGLYHIAFQVGTSLDELAAGRRWAESHGLQPFGEMEAGESASFSIRDPDGHEIELYVDLRSEAGAGESAPSCGRTFQIETAPRARAATTKPNPQR
jgi:catechol-2,3-dioxygenase